MFSTKKHKFFAQTSLSFIALKIMSLLLRVYNTVDLWLKVESESEWETCGEAKQ